MSLILPSASDYSKVHASGAEESNIKNKYFKLNRTVLLLNITVESELCLELVNLRSSPLLPWGLYEKMRGPDRSRVRNLLLLILQEEPKILDTRELPVFRKRVCPQSSQDECESRRLWHKVTHALNTDDIESATSAKHQVSSFS